MFSGSAFAAAPFAATGSNTFNVAVNEDAILSDSAVARVLFISAISELSTISDAVSVAASIFGAIASEAATGSDSVAVSASTFGTSIAETAAAADSILVAPSTFNAQIAETVAALDQVYALAVFLAVISESSTIIDIVTARLLWELINDSQNAGWQTINTAQSTTWTTINDSVPTTWSDIPTLD